MLLRASGEIAGTDLDVQAISDRGAADASGIAYADVLLAFADAVVDDDEEQLAAARARVRRELGDAQLVDAAAVASNFERMVRIADSTGIPLDPPMAVLSEELRGTLGLERFGSAANTPAQSTAERLLGPVARRTASGVLRLVGAARRLTGYA